LFPHDRTAFPASSALSPSNAIMRSTSASPTFLEQFKQVLDGEQRAGCVMAEGVAVGFKLSRYDEANQKMGAFQAAHQAVQIVADFLVSIRLAVMTAPPFRGPSPAAAPAPSTPTWSWSSGQRTCNLYIHRTYSSPQFANASRLQSAANSAIIDDQEPTSQPTRLDSEFGCYRICRSQLLSLEPAYLAARAVSNGSPPWSGSLRRIHAFRAAELRVGHMAHYHCYLVRSDQSISSRHDIEADNNDDAIAKASLIVASDETPIIEIWDDPRLVGRLGDPKESK
jgi:hypothetical protein